MASKYTLLKNPETGIRSIRINPTNEVVYETAPSFVLLCGETVSQSKYADLRKRALACINRKMKAHFYESCGLTKVKGAVSGKTYWE
jgi:hypothetical protein